MGLRILLTVCFFYLKKVKELRSNFSSWIARLPMLYIWDYDMLCFALILRLGFTLDFSNNFQIWFCHAQLWANIFALSQYPLWVFWASIWIWVTAEHILDSLPSKIQGMFSIMVQCFQQERFPFFPLEKALCSLHNGLFPNWKDRTTLNVDRLVPVSDYWGIFYNKEKLFFHYLYQAVIQTWD